MTDPYEALASQIVAPRRAQLRAAATRAERKREKELRDGDELFKSWQHWHKEKKLDLLAGEYSKAAHALTEFLERMGLEDANALLDTVTHGPWKEADIDTKATVLSMVDARIVYVRERAGLVPFDDSLFPLTDDEPTAFELLREWLR